MLHQLANYASKYKVPCLPGFRPKTAQWVIVLTGDGEFVDVIKEEKEFSLAPDLQQKELIAGGITRSHFLLDTIDVVTTYSAGKRELKKHIYFLNLLQQATVYEKSLGKIYALLKNDDHKQRINEIIKTRKGRKTDTVTFRIGNIYPIELDTWHPWWQEYRNSLKGTKDIVEEAMVCLLSGKRIVPELTHLKVGGLTRVGGQSTGTVLVGFDKDSFTSYGLKQSLNAACSEEAIATYRGALQNLIAKAPQPLAGIMFLSWFKEPIPTEDNLLDLDSLENPLAQEASARERVERLFAAVRQGKRPDLLNNRYYILQLSATGGRIMLRDWMEGEYKTLIGNFKGWFDDLELVSPDGKGKAKDTKLIVLLSRLVGFRRGEAFSKVRERIDQELPPLMPKIWRSIIEGRTLPDTVASKALAYIRSNLYSADEDYSTGNLDRIACALLKAWLVRKKDREEVNKLKTELNPRHPEPAYHLGRLMAVLAALQGSALGDVGAGVVQRYYAAASTTPSLVLGRLIQGAQHHINKLDKGLGIWYERMMEDIITQLDAELPSTLGLEGQTLFALGYYQQKAAMGRKTTKKEEGE
ncbi:MAG: type I-C CRISPR-associated protein Cas8c/Csd1 [Firmicutes bacterium]|nr:type I-C CRISPR-associated protein Cas8c/Csd1 [Bacillota bacterium]